MTKSLAYGAASLAFATLLALSACTTPCSQGGPCISPEGAQILAKNI